MIYGIDTANNVEDITMSLKNQQYQFVARYYSLNSWKVATTSEIAAIKNAGMKMVTVYQDSNNEPQYFTEEIAQQQASYAISLARSKGQATGSAIYFAVDFDATSGQISEYIIPYFNKLKPVITSAGYYLGVYGSGLVCSTLKNAGIVSYTWLSMSTGWQGYNTFTSWNIKQLRTTTYTGVDVDINQANTINSIGAW